MKKIFLILILSVMGAITCKAQLTHTSEFVKVNLPNGAYKLSKQQVDALSRQTSLGKMPEALRSPFTYDINGITLNMNNANQDSISNNIPRKKRFLDELYSSLKHHGNNTYKSIIKSVGNKNALILSYTTIDSHYVFYVQNTAKTLTLSGKIDYKETDSVKASALLDDILNNIQFTK